VVEKCTFCHHRLMAARAKATYQAKIAAAKAKKTGPVKIDPPRYQTACAEACPAKAINFGIISDPREPVAELIKVGHIETHKSGPKWYKFRLLENLGTNPKIHYITRRKWIVDAANNSLTRPFAAQLFKS
jgi:Fe-S-cluster-containing dehydrogenase component